MTFTTALIITILAVVFSALFSGMEIAYVQSNKIRMQIDGSRGGVVDRIIRGFSHNEDMFISSLLVGNNVVLVIYGITLSVLINPVLERWFGDSEAMVLVVNTVFSTLVILLCGEFIPKATFRINPNFMMRMFALPLYVIYIVLYPVSKFISFITKGLMGLFGIKENKVDARLITMDQLDDYLEEQLHSKQQQKEEVENEVKIFRNAVDFKDTTIGECMRPRNEIIAVDIDSTTREDLLSLFSRTGLSKIVVYREDIDDVVGYIHISELFNLDSVWSDHLKPVIFTPETMLANKMMRRMIAEKRSVCIVIDEFGGTSGLATLEDLVEEIFGEIEDEHDREKQLFRRLPDGGYEISGRAEIAAINDELGLDLKESEDYNTIAGYILHYTEALPDEGDTFEVGELKFTVTRMSTTRIEQVKVCPISKE
ncbi:MAG: hemolysin family protein [Muribaculaceae bacterium]|nr:hemolysin family protein [Muribaculaceae bacterium]MDE6552682.1 hemolysin family protein [Muribaculaceae bacterium]